VLINYILSSLHIFMMSFFEVHAGGFKKTRHHSLPFFSNMDISKKIHSQNEILFVSLRR
jgi:hypothetical protein